MRVAWKVAGPGEVALGDKRTTLSFLAEARILERDDHRDGVAIVRAHQVHILRLQARHLECVRRRNFDWRSGDRWCIGNRRMIRELTCAEQPYRRMLGALRDLRRGHDNGCAATGGT